MKVKEIMSVPAITVGPEEPVAQIAELLLTKRISAVPVVDDNDKPLGMVSEGDLMRRPESGTERATSWWLDLIADSAEQARTFVKTHGTVAQEVMSTPAITVREDNEMADVVDVLEEHRIKRVAVVREDRVIGVVSRANLLRAFASQVRHRATPPAGDEAIRDAVLEAMKKVGFDTSLINVIVSHGIVHLWGQVEVKAQRDALVVSAEEVVERDKVDNHVAIMHPLVRATYGGV